MDWQPNVPGNGEEFDEQEIACKLSELNEKSNRGDVLRFLVKAKVPFTTEIDSTSSRVKYLGPYLYKIRAYNIEWTFMPTGALELCLTEGPR